MKDIIFTPTAKEDNPSEDIKIQRHYEGKEPYFHDFHVLLDAVGAYVGDSPTVIDYDGESVEVTSSNADTKVYFGHEDGLLFGAGISTNFPIEGSRKMGSGERNDPIYYLVRFETNELLRIRERPNAVAEFVWFVLGYAKYHLIPPHG